MGEQRGREKNKHVLARRTPPTLVKIDRDPSVCSGVKPDERINNCRAELHCTPLHCDVPRLYKSALC